MAIDMSNLSEEEAKKIQLLHKKGWILKNGCWSHPKRCYQGLPYLFSFEDAWKAQLKNTEAQYLAQQTN